MHIGIALFRYFPYGGLQRDCLRVAEAALARGYEITVFTREWQGPVPDGLNLVLAPRAGVRNHIKDRKFVDWLVSVRDNYPLDVLFGFNRMPGLDYYFAADVCYRYRRPPRGWSRLSGRARHFLKYEETVFSPGLSTKIFALSQRQKEEYQASYGTEEARFQVVPAGISRDFAHNEEDAVQAREFVHGALGLEENGRTLFVHVGSDFNRKGVDRCIKALQGAPTGHLAVIGQGKTANYLRQARSLGVEDRVHFIGPSDVVRDWMLGADIMLHPAREENTGTVLAEALVAGLPIIASGETGYAYHVARSGAGMALPSPFSQDALNGAVREACNATHRRKWRQAALSYARQEDFYNLMAVILDTIGADVSMMAPAIKGKTQG